MVWPHLYKMPAFVQQAFPNLTWFKECDEKALFLTFDDGPDKTLTPWILNRLNDYKATATFFCVGDRAASNPEAIEAIQAAGHRLGNHTYHHLNGWRHNPQYYRDDVEACKELVPSSLFRPPYGKIKPSQFRLLNELGYEIIMWDVLTYDFDPNLNLERTYATLTQKIEPGSIVIFHDSKKAAANLEQLLPWFLAYFSNQGYRFQTL